MYLTILKLLSPYLQRMMAKKAADYLTQRRDRRLQQLKGEQIDPNMEVDPAVSPLDVVSSGNPLVIGLLGVMVGSVFGFVLAQLLSYRQKENPGRQAKGA